MEWAGIHTITHSLHQLTGLGGEGSCTVKNFILIRKLFTKTLAHPIYISPYIYYNNQQKLFIFFMAVIFLRVYKVMMDKYSCTYSSQIHSP